MTLYSPKGYGFDEILSSPQLTGSALPTEVSFSIPQTPENGSLERTVIYP